MMRITTPKKRLEPAPDRVKIDEEWQDGIEKALEKKRPEDHRPKGAERPQPNPRSMEVQDG